MRTKVYIAAPITLGDRAHNLRQAEEAFRALMDAGFAPLMPQLTMHLPYAWDIPHEVWLEQCEPWVRASDVVLRLPGESRGSDQEVAWAVEEGISVFYSLEALLGEVFA